MAGMVYIIVYHLGPPLHGSPSRAMTRTVYGKRFAALHRARSATGVASDAPHGVHVVDVDVAGVALAGAPCGSLAATYATPSPHAS